MKRLVIVNTPECPIIWTQIFHVQKISKGFEWNGLEVLFVESWKQLKEIGLCETDFVYLANHFAFLKTDMDMESLKSNPVIYLYLEYIGSVGAIPILWFWHLLIDTQILEPLKGKFILTGENFRQKPKTSEHTLYWNIQNKINNYVPSTFAAAIHPNDIGTFKRNEFKKVSFVGSVPYQGMWLNKLLREMSSETMFTISGKPFISEENRIKHFLDSVVCLGFHAEANISNSVLVERVFEGMALGNVVISDNPCCTEVTNGNVEFVDSYETMLTVIDKAWNDIEYRKKKQKESMNWCRDHGTYLPVAKLFIDKARELYA